MFKAVLAPCRVLPRKSGSIVLPNKAYSLGYSVAENVPPLHSKAFLGEVVFDTQGKIIPGRKLLPLLCEENNNC